ncbi:GAF domain-containing protein, partial [Candidatus Bathyarchaeota archaeon]|nr:GAF domain-containing protein [Candidatus Bathyarchaeota archaeon]
LVNQVWLDQAGLKKEKVLNRHMADIFPSIIEAGRLDVYKEVLRTGESRELQHCIHPGGKETWFNIRVFKVGEGLGLITRDITKEVTYRQRLETLHKHTVILQNADNEAEIVEKTFGILVDGLEYETVDIIKCEDGKLLDFHTTTPETFEIPITGPGITARACRLAESQLVQDTSKDPDYILGTHEARHRSELVVPVLIEGKVKLLINIESKKPYSLTLEDKKLVELLAGHIGSQLESLKLESERIRANLAEEMEEMKSKFMHTATHELRTPLTSMKGFLELAIDEDEPEVLQRYLDIVYRNTQRLEALTNDLLDQQRLEEGGLDINPVKVDLIKLVSAVVNDLEPILDKRDQRIQVTVPENVVILVDEMRFQEILFNLLDNASKYSPEGSTIWLSAKVCDGRLQVSVRDEGIGLSEEDISKLFKPFPDIDNPVVSDQSVGLGLSICKGIVELHEGEIWAESPGPGEGSTFFFTISEVDLD